MKKRFIYLTITIAIFIGLSFYFNNQANTKKYLSKWILPTKSTCINNDGKFTESQFCKATYEDAKKICNLNNAFLPSKDDLKKFVLSCEGSPNEKPNESYEVWDENSDNKFYTECYEKKGYLSLTYWSQNISPNYLIGFEGDARFAWMIRLGFGNIREDHVLNKNYVWCISDN